DVGGREAAPQRALGEIGRVLPLVLGRPAAEAQRLIGAVGLRVVADVEVRTELRRREVEAAAYVRVPRGDWREYDREPCHEDERSLRSRGSGFGTRDSGFGTRDSGFGIRDS